MVFNKKNVVLTLKIRVNNGISDQEDRMTNFWQRETQHVEGGLDDICTYDVKSRKVRLNEDFKKTINKAMMAARMFLMTDFAKRNSFFNQFKHSVLDLNGEELNVFTGIDKWFNEQRRRAALCIPEIKKAHTKLKRKLESQIYRMEKDLSLNLNIITIELFTEVSSFYKEQCKQIFQKYNDAVNAPDDIVAASWIDDESIHNPGLYDQRAHTTSLINKT